MALFLLVVLVSAPLGISRRLHAEQADDADQRPCIGCNVYPSAPDYPDDWTTPKGQKRLVEELMEKKDGEELTPEELRLKWDMAQQVIFSLAQSQGCMDTCAVCVPDLADMAREETAKLQTIHMSRAKNWQNMSIWPVLGPVDVALGAVTGGIVGLPLAVMAFFGGGIATGSKAGTAVANSTKVDGERTAFGNLLGIIAGLSTGAVSGAAYAAAVEVLALMAGLYKGVGLTAALTDCKRVGFERFRDGENRDEGSAKEQPFTSIPGNSQYGLKRMRQWMKDNADWQHNMARDEIGPGDQASLEHCERVREHDFDMRHASECLKHSQLCGPGGGIIVPAPGGLETCKALSDVNYLETKAIALGDDPETGLFAQWREMQRQMQEHTGAFEKKALCVKTLCEYNGFKRASLKFHPDRLAHLPEEERTLAEKKFLLLSECKSEYDLTLNSKEEREQVCPKE